MIHIHTQFHHLVDLIQKDEVYLTAPKGGKAVHWDTYHPDKKATNFFLKEISSLPKFVVDDELMDMVRNQKYIKSIVDMRKGGVMRLPFPSLLIEYDFAGKRYIVLLRDQQSKEIFPWEDPAGHELASPFSLPDKDELMGRFPFYGTQFILDKDKDGRYVVMSPSFIGVDVMEKNGEASFGMSAIASGIFPPTQELDALVGQTYSKDAGGLYQAMCAALLVMQTDGVVHEKIDPSKINRKRDGDSKPKIPTHTYLRIGKVYRYNSEKADDYIPRKSPRPHWRRGHLRPVRYGVGKTLVKDVYINPRLVSYKPVENEPSMAKEYNVIKDRR